VPARLLCITLLFTTMNHEKRCRPPAKCCWTTSLEGGGVSDGGLFRA
jgi:hypothetical protein